jgi:hypothetical protein
MCSCGEISICGGPYAYECGAKDYSNFLRLDDMGNEIVVKVEEDVGKSNIKTEENVRKPNKQDLLDMLDEMIGNIEKLPSNAMSLPVNHYDLASALVLLSSILRSF